MKLWLQGRGSAHGEDHWLRPPSQSFLPSLPDLGAEVALFLKGLAHCPYSGALATAKAVDGGCGCRASIGASDPRPL